MVFLQVVGHMKMLVELVCYLRVSLLLMIIFLHMHRRVGASVSRSGLMFLNHCFLVSFSKMVLDDDSRSILGMKSCRFFIFGVAS